ncbi:MAG: hypothetical protein ACMUIP_08515 [bacterium]
MTLSEILTACGDLEIVEKRSIDNEYNELVFLNKEIDQWKTILSEICGPPIKPAGIKPTAEDLMTTKDYGGIFNNQTLFKKEFDNGTIIAMFWPWQDSVHVTLKMALLNK